MKIEEVMMEYLVWRPDLLPEVIITYFHAMPEDKHFVSFRGIHWIKPALLHRYNIVLLHCFFHFSDKKT